MKLGIGILLFIALASTIGAIQHNDQFYTIVGLAESCVLTAILVEVMNKK